MSVMVLLSTIVCTFEACTQQECVYGSSELRCSSPNASCLPEQLIFYRRGSFYLHSTETNSMEAINSTTFSGMRAMPH